MKRMNSWGLLTAAALGAGMLGTYLVIDHLFRTGTTPKELLTVLVGSVLIGFVVNGAATALRAFAHNRFRRIDGWGKVLSVLGWSISATGTFFVATRSDAISLGQTFYTWTATLVTFFAIALIACSFIRPPEQAAEAPVEPPSWDPDSEATNGYAEATDSPTPGVTIRKDDDAAH